MKAIGFNVFKKNIYLSPWRSGRERTWWCGICIYSICHTLLQCLCTMSNSGQSGGWQGGGVVGGRHMPHATSHIDQASNHQTISSTWPAQPLNLTPPPSSYELCKSLAANVAQTQTQIRIQPQAERERGRARVRWPVEEKNQTKSIDVQIFLTSANNLPAAARGG